METTNHVARQAESNLVLARQHVLGREKVDESRVEGLEARGGAVGRAETGADGFGREEEANHGGNAARMGSGWEEEANLGGDAARMGSGREEEANLGGNAAGKGWGIGENGPGVSAMTVIVFCFNRAEYLKRTLESLRSALGNARGEHDVVISQDGNDKDVAAVAMTFVQEVGEEGRYKARLVQHKRDEQRLRGGNLAAYYALSEHYKKGLSLAFKDKSTERVVVLEDDLLLGADFFPYFEAFAPMLDQDKSLLAVSAWNDHGQGMFVSDPRAFFRSDFFPGLGWMMPRRIWDDLGPKWPEAFWDDWIREPQQRNNRQVIHPEVSRTTTFGASGGASSGQFYREFLESMKLNNVLVTYDQALVDSLSQENFETSFMQSVADAKVVVSAMELSLLAPGQPAKFYYSQLADYENLATTLGIINDVKAGVPRGAYKGVVPIRIDGRRVFLAPRHI